MDTGGNSPAGAAAAFAAAVAGDFVARPPQPQPGGVRFVVSAPLTGSRAERDALAAYVFPDARALARVLDVPFEVVDFACDDTEDETGGWSGGCLLYTSPSPRD